MHEMEDWAFDILEALNANQEYDLLKLLGPKYDIDPDIVIQMFSAMTRGGGTVLDITSPVESSSLAEAVRTDWAGLSREAHIRSLVEDALTNIDSLTSASFPTESAVRRLMFYYPKEGEEFAIKLLGRFIYCDDAVSSLFERLLPEEGADGWRRVIDAFVREHGEPYAEVIRALLRTAVITDPGEYERQFIGDEALRVIAKVEKILAAIYPTYEREPYTAYFVNAVRLFDQGRLIEALKPFKSKKIDKAVHEAFKSNAPERFEGDNLDYYMDLFAIVCMSRSIGTEYDAQYRAYCERRIKEIEATDEKPEEDAMLAALKEWLKKLGKSGK
ncbi:MAG: hypothetical protein IH851_08265 [Armatimonadetes bacterium]|nr:hypothetical protein [Armatimonadota bacterium]